MLLLSSHSDKTKPKVAFVALRNASWDEMRGWSHTRGLSSGSFCRRNFSPQTHDSLSLSLVEPSLILSLASIWFSGLSYQFYGCLHRENAINSSATSPYWTSVYTISRFISVLSNDKSGFSRFVRNDGDGTRKWQLRHGRNLTCQRWARGDTDVRGRQNIRGLYLQRENTGKHNSAIN